MIYENYWNSEWKPALGDDALKTLRIRRQIGNLNWTKTYHISFNEFFEEVANAIYRDMIMNTPNE